MFVAASAGAGTPSEPRRLPPPPARSAGAPEPKRTPDKRDFAGDTVLVRFRAGVSAPAREAAARDHGLALAQAVRGTSFSVVETQGRSTQAAVAALRSDPRVADVQLNHLRRATDIPDDPRYANWQWLFMDLMRVPEAWDVAKGSPAFRIAVVDTGVDLEHSDFAGRIGPGRDVVNDDAVADDDEGHGTHVAAVAAAPADNGIGMAGAAWDATILPVKVLDRWGSGTDADVAEGIVWAADNGADVINLSLGGPADSAVLRQAVAYAVARDAVVVAAAGNDGAELPSYPAAIPEVVAVSATDYQGRIAAFTSYGWFVDIAAPGTNVPGPQLWPPDTYEGGDGTSFSAPFVSGVALLVRAAHPSWTAAQVVEQLKRGARDLGPRGRDRFYGAGLLDAYAALGAARQGAPASERGDAHEPNDSPDQATVAGIGPLQATIAPVGDVDWFAVDVTAPGWLALTVGPPTNTPTYEDMDAILEVYRPDLRLLGHEDRYAVDGVERLEVRAASPGRYYVAVRNYHGSRSATAYTLYVQRSDTVTSHFQPVKAYATGAWPESVAIADVTGDGKPDALMTTGAYDDSPNDLKLLVFPQGRFGGLGAPTAYNVGEGGWGMGVAAGDLTGDGKADAVVSTWSGLLLYRQVAGTLAAPTLVPGTDRARHAEMADMDLDGDLDVVLNRETAVVLLRNDGTGNFTGVTVRTPGVWEVEIGDATGDGRPDVVGAGGITVVVHEQRPDGTFVLSGSYTATTGYWRDGNGLDVSDVTGDGRDDASWTIGGNFPGSMVNVFAQTNEGRLAPPVTYATLDIPEPLEGLDMTGDGRTDLVMAHGGWLAVGLMRQKADGTLDREESFWVPYASHYNPKGLAVGDISSDGDPDVVLADYNHGLVVLHAQSDTPVPGPQLWVRGTSPHERATGLPAGTSPTVRFVRALDPTSVSAATVRLLHGDTGEAVPAAVSYAAGSRTATITPTAQLAAGTPYLVHVAGVRDVDGEALAEAFTSSFTIFTAADTVPPETDMTEPGHLRTVAATITLTADASDDRAVSRVEFLADGAVIGTDTTAPYSLTWSTASRPNDSTVWLRTRAVDSSGNAALSPSRRITIDNRPPRTTITGLPVAATSTSVKLTFAADEQGVHFYCSLDGSTHTICGHTWPFHSLAPGSHTISVFAIDAVGNWETGRATGTFRVGASESGSPPANDAFASPRDLAGAAGSVSGSNMRASRETGEPTHAAGAGARSVWFRWTAPSSRTVSFDTVGSSFDTLLAVYTGSEVGNLWWMASDDDSALDLESRVTFTPVAGTTYRIAVDGYQSTSGDVVLRWGTPGAELDTTIVAGAALTVAGAPSFSFASDGASAFECRVDAAAWSACSSPARVDALVPGPHTFAVRALGIDGRADATPATRDFRVVRPFSALGRAVWRPVDGTWHRPDTPVLSWGRDGDVPVPGDYDTDADVDIAVWRPSNGGWYVQGSPTVYFGSPGDVPVPADYDGDGKTEIAVWRPPSGAWFVRGRPVVYFGRAGDLPVPGDYDADPQLDVAVWRPASGGWYVQGSPTVYHGLPTDVPVPADYSGDGKAELAVWRPAVGGWYVRGAPTTYLGQPGDVPVPGRWDADAGTEIAIWRPASGAWIIPGSSTVWLGGDGDVP